EGVFGESLNFAVLKKLPILFGCENNQYAIHTHQSLRQGNTDICGRARSFGLPAGRLDGTDLPALVAKARGVVARVRAGEAPAFLEAATYRWREHVGPGEDYHLGYRTADEAKAWKEADALVRLAALVEERERRRLEEEVEEEIAQAFAFAEAS